MTVRALPRFASDALPTAFLAALAIAGAGILAILIALLFDPHRALLGYLAAWGTVLWIALGALSIVLIADVTGAAWFLVVRHLALAVTGVIPLLAVLALPILIGVGVLYPWVPPLEGLARHIRESIEAKDAYLNVPFFVGRSIVYLASWVALAEWLRRSALRDERDVAGGTVRSRGAGALGLMVLGVTATFAAFDWFMSLSPEWASTIFGVYLWAGGMVGALAVITLLAVLARRGLLEGWIGRSHLHALGRLLLTFVIFWAYIGFSQYLVIWIADLPHEIGWYRARTSGSWGNVALVLLIGHFAVPFLLLLVRAIKETGPALAVLSGWLVAMHALDLYWIVLPTAHPYGLDPSWIDVAALGAITGMVMLVAIWRIRGTAALPPHDPRLAESRSYRAEARL